MLCRFQSVGFPDSCAQGGELALHILGAEEDIVVASHVLYPLVIIELEFRGVGWGDNPADGTEGLRGLNIFHIILALHTIAEYIKL